MIMANVFNFVKDTDLLKVYKRNNRIFYDTKNDKHIKLDAMHPLIIFGDNKDALKKIANHSINVVIQDPPYEQDTTELIRKKECGLNHTRKHNQHIMYMSNGYDIPFILKQMHRVLISPNFYTFYSRHQLFPLLSYVHEYNQKHHTNQIKVDNFILGKKCPSPFCNHSYLKDKESCLYMHTKGHVDGCYYTCRTWYETSCRHASKRNHMFAPTRRITVKPLLPEINWINNSSESNDVVLDSFLGSGTTAIASMITGRRFIGIEDDASNYHEAKHRIINMENDLI